MKVKKNYSEISKVKDSIIAELRYYFGWFWKCGSSCTKQTKRTDSVISMALQKRYINTTWSMKTFNEQKTQLVSWRCSTKGIIHVMILYLCDMYRQILLVSAKILLKVPEMLWENWQESNKRYNVKVRFDWWVNTPSADDMKGLTYAIWNEC